MKTSSKWDRFHPYERTCAECGAVMWVRQFSRLILCDDCMRRPRDRAAHIDRIAREQQISLEAAAQLYHMLYDPPSRRERLDLWLIDHTDWLVGRAETLCPGAGAHDYSRWATTGDVSGPLPSGAMAGSGRHGGGDAMSLYQRVVLILGAVGLVAILLFVWPTLYRYDHIKMGPYSYPVRIHRITGGAEMLYQTGWGKLGPPPPAKAQSSLSGATSDLSVEEIIHSYHCMGRYPGYANRRQREVPVPNDEFQKLSASGNASINSLPGNIQAYIGNDSCWVIKTVTLRLTFENKKKRESFSRDYILSPTDDGSKAGVTPLHSAAFSAPVGFMLEPGQTWSWDLISATGHIGTAGG